MMFINKRKNRLMLVFAFLFIFFHVFNLKFNLPPYNLILFPFLFSLFYICRENFEVKDNFCYALIFIVVQFFILLISFLINQKVDFYFFKEIILFQLISLFSAYYIVFFVQKNTYSSVFDKVSYIVFIAVAFQLIFSFLGYVNQNVFDILFKIFNLGDEEIVTHLSEERMVGIGATFFGSGVINCLVLILISSFIVTENNFKSKIKLLLLYFIIATLGILSARTTSIGIILSLILIFSNLKNFKLKIFFLSFIVLILFVVLNVKSFGDSRIGQLLTFSIGFLTDFQGSNASNSTSDLLSMYSNLPNNFKTWLIGDALYRDGYGYYKGTDVGYFRFIFATGLIGLFFYVSFIIYLILKIQSERITVVAKIFLFFLFFILMGKGVAIFFPVLLLLYFSSLRKKSVLI